MRYTPKQGQQERNEVGDWHTFETYDWVEYHTVRAVTNVAVVLYIKCNHKLGKFSVL
jgi:hypothetical protein